MSVIKNITIAAIGAIAALLISKAWKSYFDQPVEITNQNNCGPQHPANQSIITFDEDDRDYDQIQKIMICPISGTLMKNPWIVTECGHSFEEKQIIKWLKRDEKCPLCNKKAVQKNLKPNFQLKQVIRAYENKKKQPIGSINANNN